MVDPAAASSALLGVHVGDALGATTEFAERDVARQLLPSTVADTEIVGGGILDWPPGAATDDTDLTLAITRAYLETSARTTAEVVARAAEHMLAWKRQGPRDIGGATAAGLAAYERTRDPSTSGVADERSQGNGSLMRTIAVGLVRATNPRRRADEARALSAVTHAHPVCCSACVAYCQTVAALATDPSLRTNPTARRRLLTSIATEPDTHPAVSASITRAIDARVDEIEGVNGQSQGWVLTSFALAVAAVQDPRPAAEVLLDVVRLGGDADTNGAICGGLLGARDGVSAWPQRWLDRLEHRDELRTAATHLARLDTVTA